MSGVTFHMSCVRCHVSGVKCTNFFGKKNLNKIKVQKSWELFGGVSVINAAATSSFIINLHPIDRTGQDSVCFSFGPQ